MVKRFRFAKAGLICLAVVVVLGGIGVAYGYSSGTLKAGDMMAMACSNGLFTWVVSNDDGEVTSISLYGDIDPGDDGGGANYDKWGDQSSDDPSEPQARGVKCARYDKDVARTTAWRSPCDRKEITVLVENAYPSYYPTVFFGLKNNQSFSIKIESIDITYDIPELTVTFDGITENQVLSSGEEVVGRLGIHTEQSAHQNSSYNVKVKIELIQKEKSGCGWGWWGWWHYRYWWHWGWWC